MCILLDNNNNTQLCGDGQNVLQQSWVPNYNLWGDLVNHMHGYYRLMVKHSWQAQPKIISMTANCLNLEMQEKSAYAETHVGAGLRDFPRVMPTVFRHPWRRTVLLTMLYILFSKSPGYDL